MTLDRRHLLTLPMTAWASTAGAQPSGPFTIAAAADLRFALDELLQGFDAGGRKVEVVYGSSGKLATQIRNGAPFDVFLAADRRFTDELAADGFATGPSRPYALGFLALWSLDADLGQLPLADAVRHPRVRRFAIANPAHAPYGQRAEQALRHQGAWNAVAPKLVLGDNIAQTATFIETGAVQAGLVALALVMAPAMAGKGRFSRIPPQWHQPLAQGFITTRRAATDPLAARFAQALLSPAAQALLRRYGFEAAPAP